MYDQIVIDCQTKKESICCEYCGVKMKCSLRFEVTESQKMQKEPSKTAGSYFPHRPREYYDQELSQRLTCFLGDRG